MSGPDRRLQGHRTVVPHLSAGALGRAVAAACEDLLPEGPEDARRAARDELVYEHAASAHEYLAASLEGSYGSGVTVWRDGRLKVAPGLDVDDVLATATSAGVTAVAMGARIARYGTLVPPDERAAAAAVLEAVRRDEAALVEAGRRLTYDELDEVNGDDNRASP